MMARRNTRMLIPTIAMAALAIAALLLAYQKGNGAHVTGLREGGIMLLQLTPLLLFAFILAGTLPLLIPTELVAKWIGTQSGTRGILIGTLIGGLLPGGPAVSLPVLAGFLRLGASMGTMIAMVTVWSLLAFTRLPLEIGIMGWRFTAIRLCCTFFLAPIAGLIAHRFFSHVQLP
jgi:uncharacterized protein